MPFIYAFLERLTFMVPDQSVKNVNIMRLENLELYGTLWLKDHSENTVSYPKSLRIQAFESLDAFKMYYAIGASVSYIRRESTYSLM